MDAAMNALSPEEQEIAAGLFRYLVTPSGTKIAYTVADLEYYARSKRSLQPVLEKLSQGNVRIMLPVTSPGEPGVIRYQIYHDVLAPAVLDWRARFENSKQQLSMFSLLIEKGDMENAFHLYQDIVHRTPQQAFFPARYEVQKILGSGELGVGYLLFDQQENVLLAATILDPGLEFTQQDLDQFASEMSRITSSRISRVLGFSQYRENTYMLSEFIGGPTVRARLGHGNPLPYQEAIHIARETIKALEDGHRRGISHLSLRPTNIMLSSDGVRLVNYGISHLTTLHLDRKRHVNRHYMDDYLAPEQLSGEGGDERSDIYALGTILYEMLIGHPPSVGRFYYPSEVSLEATEAVDILIDHAREDDPSKRFATSEEMGAEIDRITMTSLQGNANQFLRVALARLSERYKQLISGRALIIFIAVLWALLVLSVPPIIPIPVRLPARLLLPVLLNSFVISILCDWTIRALARRRGLGSLSTSGRGMGAILGLILTLHLIRMTTFEALMQNGVIVFFFIMLALAIFGTAIVLGIVIIMAWITARLFKSYTMGFYWSFVIILMIDLVLAILGIGANQITPFT
jgi:serine/threonine protein kinase